MKIVSLILGLLSTSVILGQIPSDKLEAYYPFNGQAIDESSNSHDGVVNGATLTTDRFGNLNAAYSFNGVDNNIELAVASDIFGTNPSSWSYSFWFKLEGNVASKHYCAISDYSDYDGYDRTFSTLCEFSGETGYSTSYSRETSISYTNKATDSINNADNTWRHLVVTFSKINAELNIYSNGNLVQSIAMNTSINAFSDNSVKILIGKRPLYNKDKGHPFLGDIEDVRFYSKAVNQCEVSALFNENNTLTKIVVEDTLNIYLSNLITSVYEKEKATSTIKVYPNPGQGTLTIAIDNYDNLDGVNIKVLDTQSNEVHNELVASPIQTIDASNWSAGVYFIYVLNGNYTVDIRKIVVNN